VWKWRNAWAMVQQDTLTFLNADTAWLQRLAIKENTP
jgi:hypothetical protein